jgi:G3E family GTPase
LGKIPFHIISGFLGSGKTTFLKRIIEQYSSDIKIGIIQNEYAPANIDGQELKQTGKDFYLLEINNGSVFCVCLLGDFARSLEIFIDEIQPEIIIMEASGLSDTTSVSEIVSAGKLGEKIFLASNWCIVDALNFSKTGMMRQRVNHQLRMADVVVINKTDLLQEGLVSLRSEIKKQNPFAEIIETSFCNIDFFPGRNPTLKFYFNHAEPMDRPTINSMVIKTTKTLTAEALRGFLDEWSPKAFRIKGFVNLKTGETIAVQCTFGQVELKSMGQSFFPTELIAITHEFSLSIWNKSFREYVNSGKSKKLI